MSLQTIEWVNEAAKLIDQTRLPDRLEYIYAKDIKTMWRAIKTLQVRGAPALGAAAALGMYLGVMGSRARDFESFSRDLDRSARYIASSRPTARNLFWAIERICRLALKNKDKDVPRLKRLILDEAKAIIEEDKVICRRIGYHGDRLIKDNDSILTVCNTGILATIDYGTALGVVYRAKEEGKNVKVYSCETRPVLQGARLTTWELRQKGINVTMICDNMAATLMQQGKVDKVIAGADRIASNGDTANKIGTYNLAVLASFHKIPFYIAAPLSTFDLSIRSGRDIPIEERDPQELTELYFKKPIAAKGINFYNPAFDVTPAALITAIITQKGIIKPPFKENIRRQFSGHDADK